jgi:hypothetical protein
MVTYEKPIDALREVIGRLATGGYADSTDDDFMKIGYSICILSLQGYGKAMELLNHVHFGRYHDAEKTLDFIECSMNKTGRN